MDMNSIAAAPNDLRGGGKVVSFGSGDSGGRLRSSASGAGSRRNASSAQVRAVRNEINRSELSERRRRRILQEIDDNANRNGLVNRSILADILEEFRDFLS